MPAEQDKAVVRRYSKKSRMIASSLLPTNCVPTLSYESQHAASGPECATNQHKDGIGMLAR